jgi:hypothetical protein
LFWPLIYAGLVREAIRTYDRKLRQKAREIKINFLFATLSQFCGQFSELRMSPIDQLFGVGLYSAVSKGMVQKPAADRRIPDAASGVADPKVGVAVTLRSPRNDLAPIRNG